MNQPSSSRFPTNDCYIYERYKTFLLNNVSFMALVSFQINFIRAAHRDSKNEIEKQYLQQHSLTEEGSIATFYCKVNIVNKTASPPWDNKFINSYFIYFRGVLPSSENWGLYHNYPWLVCILALNATREAIRLGGGRGGRGGWKN